MLSYSLAAHRRVDRPRAVFVRFAPWMGFQNSHPHDLMWPVSLLYAASIAREKGWDTEVIDLHVPAEDDRELVARIQAARPDVLLMDSTTPSARFAVQTARRLRDATDGLPIWGMGQHASELSADLVHLGSPFDGALLGEIDASIGALLDGGGQAPARGAAVFDTGAGRLVRPGERRQIDDCDALPPVDPTPLNLDAYRMHSVHVPRVGRVRWGFLLTSRGCPFSCSFCSPAVRQTWGRRFRAHSPERVVDDMARLMRDHAIDAFYAMDDIFSLDRERVVAICEEILRRDLRPRWVVQTRPDMVDLDLMRLMRRAGCWGVKMGVEAGSDRILKEIKKGSTAAQMLDAGRAIRQAGLSCTAYYIVGHPTETLEEMEETRRLAHRIRADMIQVSFHTPYPGSATWEQHQDRVTDKSQLAHYETSHLNLSGVDDDRLQRFQRSFYLRYYFSPRVLWRYLTRRLPYRAADPEEWRLAWGALRYLLLRRGRA